MFGFRKKARLKVEQKEGDCMIPNAREMRETTEAIISDNQKKFALLSEAEVVCKIEQAVSEGRHHVDLFCAKISEETAAKLKKQGYKVEAFSNCIEISWY